MKSTGTTVFVSTFSTPFGAFTVGVDESERVIATAFGDGGDVLSRFSGRDVQLEDARTDSARRQLREYFDCSRREFDLSVAPEGTEFQQAVWRRLRGIPFGRTTNYGGIAKELGSSARAVGRANATNPICVIIPCHRVIGADGSLTGFAYGEEMKRRLLELEGALLAFS